MKLILTNLASDITGFKLALIDERNPAAASTPATAKTTLVAGSHSLTQGGTTTSMTLTAGGSVAKWITKPLKNAITLPAVAPHINYWALRGSTAGHAAVDFRVQRFTVSNQGSWTTVTTTSHTDMGFRLNAMISSTTAQNRTFAAAVPGTQAFSAGDRIIIKPSCVNAFKSSTTAAAQSAGTITMDFDANLDGVDGDTWIDIPVGNTTALQGATAARQIIAGVIQATIPLATQGTVKGTQSTAPGLGKGFYQNLIDQIDAAVGTGEFTKDCSLLAFYNELVAERNNI